MDDPLFLLFHHGKSSNLEGDNIVFVDSLESKIEVNRKNLTRFHIRKNPKEFYPIDALWFCVKNIGLTLQE